MLTLADVSDIFYFFSAWEGEGGVRGRREGGGRFYLKIPEGGGVVLQEGPGGREGVCDELGIFGGGGG